MTASIQASGLALDFPVYTVRAQSLRNALLNVTVGGRLMKNRRDVTIIRALSGVSFRLNEGDRLALVGNNGSGKTSLLKLLAGVYSPTAGALQIQGRVTSMLSMSIGLDAEATGLRNMETLLMMQMLSKKEIKRRIPHIVAFSGLGHYVNMPFKTYSAGMMARLTFAVGTEVPADILLMDEWIGAGDANFRDQAAARVDEFVGAAKMVVLATHEDTLVRRICNKVLHLEFGGVKYFGPTDEWFEARQAAAG